MRFLICVESNVAMLLPNPPPRLSYLPISSADFYRLVVLNRDHREPITMGTGYILRAVLADRIWWRIRKHTIRNYWDRVHTTKSTCRQERVADTKAKNWNLLKHLSHSSASQNLSIEHHKLQYRITQDPKLVVVKIAHTERSSKNMLKITGKNLFTS